MWAFFGGGGVGGADMVLVFSLLSSRCGHGNTESVLACFSFLFCKLQSVLSALSLVN